jgi:hypothetical protein
MQMFSVEFHYQFLASLFFVFVSHFSKHVIYELPVVLDIVRRSLPFGNKCAPITCVQNETCGHCYPPWKLGT